MLPVPQRTGRPNSCPSAPPRTDAAQVDRTCFDEIGAFRGEGLGSISPASREIAPDVPPENLVAVRVLRLRALLKADRLPIFTSGDRHHDRAEECAILASAVHCAADVFPQACDAIEQRLALVFTRWRRSSTFRIQCGCGFGVGDLRPEQGCEPPDAGIKLLAYRIGSVEPLGVGHCSQATLNVISDPFQGGQEVGAFGSQCFVEAPLLAGIDADLRKREQLDPLKRPIC